MFVSITDLGAVSRALGELAAPFAVDCECGEDGTLSLVQVCDSQGRFVAVDFARSPNIKQDLVDSGLAILLTSPDYVRVTFAAHRLSRLLEPWIEVGLVFDVLGMGQRLLDNSLVQSLGDLMDLYGVDVPYPSLAVGFKPVKSWQGRPLTGNQRTCAERQVQFLLPLYSQLVEEATSRDLLEVCHALRVDVMERELRDPTPQRSVPQSQLQGFKMRMAKAKRSEQLYRLALPRELCLHFHAHGQCTALHCKFQH